MNGARAIQERKLRLPVFLSDTERHRMCEKLGEDFPTKTYSDLREAIAAAEQVGFYGLKDIEAAARLALAVITFASESAELHGADSEGGWDGRHKA